MRGKEVGVEGSGARTRGGMGGTSLTVTTACGATCFFFRPSVSKNDSMSLRASAEDNPCRFACGLRDWVSMRSPSKTTPAASPVQLRVARAARSKISGLQNCAPRREPSARSSPPPSGHRRKLAHLRRRNSHPHSPAALSGLDQVGVASWLIPPSFPMFPSGLSCLDVERAELFGRGSVGAVGRRRMEGGGRVEGRWGV